MIAFQPAGKADAGKIFEMERELILTYEDLSLIDTERVFAWVKNKILQNITAYNTVLQGSSTAGYFYLKEQDGKLELDGFFILPPFRGQGIGTQVIRYCTAQADTKGIALFLYVFTRNIRAIRFYQRAGFQFLKRVSPTREIWQRPIYSKHCDGFSESS